MQTELKRLQRGSADFARTRQLYRAAFPSNERAPFFMLVRRAQRARADWWGIYEGGEWIGFFYVVTDARLAYIFYFAIDEQKRGRGCGTRALGALRAQYEGSRIFLATEALDPAAQNYAERVRRKQFYLRSGMEDLHTRAQEGDVVYELLGTGGSVSGREYSRLIRKWAGPVLSRMIVMKILPD
nr:GNAT family N-acetyltransferase [uncultured Agathobaculum sp.]